MNDVNLCSQTSMTPLWTLIGTIINIIWIGIPVIMIILGSIDLGKAVISSKEDEVKKAKSTFIRRLIYAIAVFAVVWLVTVLFDFLGNLNLDDANTSSWKQCWCQIRGKDNCNDLTKK